jgi:hypothetical protein
LLLGERSGQRALLAEAIAIFQAAGDLPSLAVVLKLRALVALGEGDPALAAQLAGADERLREVGFLRVQDLEAPHLIRAVAAILAALDEATFAAAWATGRAWSLDEAVAAALRE